VVDKVNKCILCGIPAPWTWFCECCTKAKEEAYAESRKLGHNNFNDVISHRDGYLQKHWEEVHKAKGEKYVLELS